MLSNIIAYVISSLQYKLSSYQDFIMEHSHNKCMPQSQQRIMSLWLPVEEVIKASRDKEMEAPIHDKTDANS